MLERMNSSTAPNSSPMHVAYGTLTAAGAVSAYATQHTAAAVCHTMTSWAKVSAGRQSSCTASSWSPAANATAAGAAPAPAAAALRSGRVTALLRGERGPGRSGAVTGATADVSRSSDRRPADATS